MIAEKRNEYSLLESVPKPQPLPVVLAQQMVKARVTDTARMDILNRIYRHMTTAQQASCRVEMLMCRKANRGELLAADR